MSKKRTAAANAAKTERAPKGAAAPPPRKEASESQNAATAETLAIGAKTTTDVDVRITLICGGITNVQTPVAIGGRYDGLAFAGPTGAFDRLLDSWLTRGVDLGIIGSALGLLFPINLEQYHKARRVRARNLILAGMGEPGRFAQDSLRFLMSNIVVTVKTMGENKFACTLIGTRRNELSIGEAARGLLLGVHDGYERLRSIVDTLMDDKEMLQHAVEQPLSILLVHSEKRRDEVEHELKAIAREPPLPMLKLTVERGPDVDPDPTPTKDDSAVHDGKRDDNVAYVRISRSKSAAAPERDKAASALAPRSPLDPFPTEIFQFSALSELAAIPHREQEVNAHLLRDAAEQLTKDVSGSQSHERLGVYFADTMLPEEFRKLTEGPANVTLEVDETTAVYPWEMIAHTRYARTSFASRNVAMSRQFRSLLSPPPTSPPALNNQLRVLVIADPAPGLLRLDGARREGVEVVEVLERARIAWRDRYDIKVKVRIGPANEEQTEPILRMLRTKECVESAERCVPLELAMLIGREQHDLIHYAGHGLADPATGQTGWVLTSDCVLSAKDIFRVRQVPRLVFANACFSAVTKDYNEMRRHMTGLAQAFFARGIPNFIGAGWTVDDACAAECARWFYSRLLGLRSPDTSERDVGPATIGDALRVARERVHLLKPASSSWGAYQHYGSAGDRLIAGRDRPTAKGSGPTRPDAASAPPAAAAIGDPSTLPKPEAAPVTAPAAATAPATDLVFVNGIDFDTGQYAVAPRSIDEIADMVLKRPGLGQFKNVHADKARAFGIPFGVKLEKPEEAGWGVILSKDTPQDVRKAVEPLIEHRRKQVGHLLKVLDYKNGEQTRAWYQRHAVAPGSVDPEVVPYYLLLIGGPELIPFEFQYLIGVDYAVGRLAFDRADEYDRYVQSTIAYESGNTVPNSKEIAYWGTRHTADPATELSASLLIDPLANGMASAGGALKRAIHTEVGYARKLIAGDDATKGNLLETLHGKKPPAMLFTASHGMQLRSGQAAQAAMQGALLCQDWPGFGSMKADHVLAASDIADDANVNGMVALIFACFGAGTPDTDQFLMDLSQAGKPLAPKPFMAALPQRLLAHPNGSALAVIGHIDRAWSFSIKSLKGAEPQILPFRNSLGFIMNGAPVGYAASGQFGSRYSALSALLANATSPTALPGMRPNDRELVNIWIERNDAQNYVLLGDPAVRIRKDALG